MNVRNWMSNNRARWSAIYFRRFDSSGWKFVPRNPSKLPVTGILMLLLGASIGIGLMASTAPAESKRQDQQGPPHFKSGGERSLPILRDINSTLDRIDGRLERLEKLAAKVAEQQREGT